MHPDLQQIPDRILRLAKGALAQANHHSVFVEPLSDYWDLISILNVAHAGELFIKAIIAQEHALLLFRDLFSLDDSRSPVLDTELLIERGRTHDFEKLPQVLWAATGLRIPDMDCYDRVRKARNAVQHFLAPEEGLAALSLQFIYRVIDPLISERFGLHAIEYHEDHSVGYDYIVGAVVKAGLRFSIPSNFDLTEIDLAEKLTGATDEYRQWLTEELQRIGKINLLR